MPPRKKTKLDVDWTWAGLEIDEKEEITPLHRRRAAGIVGLKPCKLEYQFNDGDNHAESSATGAKKASVQAGCTEKACKGNPRCYNYLGIHQTLGEKAKEEYIEEKMGQVPEERDLKSPAGLRNMGATCYANAFLQLWYHNIEFRNCLYEATTTAGSNLLHLVKVFAALQHSKRKVVDPSGLVEALKLKTDDQQDAGEFCKLFMTLIEMELKRQKDPQLRNLTERLFQGRLEYVTECNGCGAKSRKEEKFLELELSLKNNDTLSDRLTALSHPETLDGDNKYHCSSCGFRCPATRRIVLKELPTYLHFSLLRFTFDVQEGERRKSKAAIRYPQKMELQGRGYELCGVVIHLGSSPYHGHFVTEVMDERTKEWYKCNDEEVTPRPKPSLLKKLGQPADGMESTKDAYMLVYKRCDGASEVNGTGANGQGSGSGINGSGSGGSKSNGVNGSGANGSNELGGSKGKERDQGAKMRDPPKEVMREVRIMNEGMEGEMSEFCNKCELTDLEFEALRAAKEPVISVLSGDDEIIPRDELKRWLSADDMSAFDTPISYASLACLHSSVDDPVIQLDPSKMSDARLISRAAFDRISSITHIPPSELCPQCIEIGFTQRMSISDRQDHVSEFDRLNATDDITSLNDNDEPDRYLISKSFLDAWRKNTLPPGALPSDPGHSLWCGHDRPWPADRQSTSISPMALSLLHTVLNDEFPLFTQSALPCTACSSTSQIDAAAKVVWQAEIKAEKLMKREINQLNVVYDTDYYILPSPWMAEWKEYHRTPGPRPPFAHDLCPHGLLKWDPANDANVDTITEKGWGILQEIYGRQKGVMLRFTLNIPRGKRFAVDCVSKEVCEGCRLQRRLKWEETMVEVVLVEDGEDEGSRRSSLTGGADGDQVNGNGNGKHPSSSASSSKPNSTSNGNGNGHSNGKHVPLSTTLPFKLPIKRPRSARAAAAASKKPKLVLIPVTPSTTVLELRGLIYAEFGISPISQSNRYGALELGDGTATMKEIGMVMDGMIRCVVLKEDEGVLNGSGGKKRRKSGDEGSVGGEEEGFGGTALVGQPRQCPACTYLNHGGGPVCTICDSALD